MGCGEAIAKANERPQTIAWAATVKQNCNPMALVHMIGRQDSGLMNNRLDDVKVAFEVYNVESRIAQSWLIGKVMRVLPSERLSW